jgi:hypothetical protein
VAELPHLARHLGVARLVRVPDVAQPQARQEQQRSQQRQDQEIAPALAQLSPHPPPGQGGG